MRGQVLATYSIDLLAELALGCVNPAYSGHGGEFTQPRAHSFAQLLSATLPPSDVRAGGVRGGDADGGVVPRAGHREVDGRGRHLPLPPQLQRSPPDLLGLHQRLRLQAQVHLGQDQQIGQSFLYSKFDFFSSAK